MTSLEKCFRSIKEATYEAVHLVAKESTTNPWWFMFVTFVEFLQLLIFPLLLILSIASDASNLEPAMNNFLLWLGISGDSVHMIPTNVWLAIYTGTLAWITLFAGLSIFTGYQSIAHGSQNHAGVRWLRIIANLSSTILFVPILSVMLQTYKCNSDGSWIVCPSISCFGGAHIGLSFLPLLFIPVHTLLSVFAVTVAFERNIRSTDLAAKTHGRCDVFALLCKFVLVLMFSLFGDSVNRWLAGLAVLASAVAYLGTFMVYMPHVRFEVNSGKCGLGASYLFATIASCLVLIDSGMDFTFFLLLGLPLAALVGYMACELRQHMIALRSFDELRSYHDISIWARKHAEIYEHINSEMQQANIDIDQNVGKNATKEMSNDSEHASDMDKRLGAVKEEVEKAYRMCMDRFPTNGTALLETASFFRNYRDNWFMEMMTLNLAKRNSRAIDVQFVIFQRLRHLREDDQSRSNGEAMGAIDRVLFDQRFNKGCELETQCYRIIYQFWMVVSREAPDIANLQVLAEELARTANQAEREYEECLKLSPDSVVALRAFGVFLSKVKREQERSSEHLNKADRLEDHKGKRKKKHIPKFSFNQTLNGIDRADDSGGIIIISGDRAQMGRILEVNTEASRILSRSKDELTGASVNAIIPKPFSFVHDLYLRRFARTGESKIINTDRCLLAIDGSGALLPLVLNFREIPPEADDENASPRLSAFIRSPKTDEHFFLFDGQSNGYRVLNADSLTLSRIMGMTSQQLEQQEVSAADYLSELKSCAETEVNSPTSSEHSNADENRIRIKQPENGNENIVIAAQGDNSASFDIQDGVGLGGELFLQSLEQAGDYTKIHFDNVADEEMEKVEARIQTISVPDYGTVFLLAWKMPTSRKRRYHRAKHRSQQKNSKEEDGDHQYGSFIVSSSSCPYASSSASTTSTHPLGVEAVSDKAAYGETDKQSCPSASPKETETKSDLSSMVQTRSLVPQGDSRERANSAQSGFAVSESQTSDVDLTEGTPFLGVQPWKDPNFFAANVNKKGKQGGSSGPESSVGTSTNVSKLMHSVVASTTTGMKPVITRLHCIFILAMIAFVTTGITLPTVMNSRYDAFHDFADGVDAGGFEMTSFTETESELFKVHISNSMFYKAAPSKSSVWQSFKNSVERYRINMDVSRNAAVSDGGEARSMELDTHFQIVDHQNADVEILSIDEIRDYMFSHLHHLASEANVSDLSPDGSLRNAVLVFDNGNTYMAAINESTEARIRALDIETESLQDEISIILTTTSTVGLTAVLAMVIYYMHRINTTRKDILTAFLYIPQVSAKWISGMAAENLKEHLEKVSNMELEGNESDNDSVSLNSGTQDGDNTHVGSEQLQQQFRTHAEPPKAWPEENSRRGSLSPSKKLQKAASSAGGRGMRRHSNTSKFVYKSLAKIVIPLIPVVVWVIFFTLNANIILDSLRNEVARGYEVKQTVAELIEYQRTLHNLAFRMTHPDTSLGTAPLEVRQAYRGNLTILSASILSRIDTVLYGGVSLRGNSVSGYDSSRVERQAFEDDACVVLGEEAKNNCEDTSLSEGLSNFIRELFNDASIILSALPAISEGNQNALEALAEDESLLRQIRNLDGGSIALTVEIGDELSTMAANSAEEAMEESLAHQQITTVLCCLSFLVATITISLSAVNTAGKSMMASFQALLLIPEEVLAANKQIRKTLKNLTSTVSSSTGDGDSSSVLVAANMQGSSPTGSSQRR